MMHWTNAGRNESFRGLVLYERDEANPQHRGQRGLMFRRAIFICVVLVVAACGDSPLQSIGQRSSEWINEPTVPTTVPVITTTPTIVTVDRLQWANDDIETQNLDDHDALLAEVFARREGDRFIQASRFEIAAALPGIAFPAEAPIGAKWVSSQLVFDNDGSLAEDPSAAFGIWSAEPYSRSRSVAQMVVLRVALDEEAAEEVAAAGSDVSCARFSDRSTDQCEMATIDGRPTWVLGSSSGTTLIWFDSPYRYEMFARNFVSSSTLRDMIATTVPLDSIAGESS